MSYLHTIIFGVLALISYGLSDSWISIVSRKVGAVRTTFWRNIFASSGLFLILVAYLFLFPHSIEISFKYILLALAVSFIGYLSVLSFYSALANGKLGIVSPISNSSILFTAALSVVLFKESLSWFQVFAIIILFIGIITTTINFRDFNKSELIESKQAVTLSFLTCILWAILFFLLKINVQYLGPILSAFIIEFGAVIYSASHMHIRGLSFQIDRRTLFFSFLAGILGALGLLFYNIGIIGGYVSIVASITFSAPLISVLYGRIFYNEYLSFQQYIGVFLILAGIIILASF
ncbi:MAG: DMT family transporter [Candidatus Woesearchaeota archaeon]